MTSAQGAKLTLKAIAALPVDERSSDEKVRLWLASPTATSEASEAGHLGFFPPETFTEPANTINISSPALTVPPSDLAKATYLKTAMERTLPKKEGPTCPRKMVRSGANCHRPIHKYNMCAYHLSQWRKNHHPMLKHP